MFFYTGCYYDSEEYLFPEFNQTCDTTNVTFSGSVTTLLDNYCLTCHSNNDAAFRGGNIKLENYSDVKAQVDNGRLEGAINHMPGFSPMPKGSSKLNDCNLTIIQKWIDDNSPNN